MSLIKVSIKKLTGIIGVVLTLSISGTLSAKNGVYVTGGSGMDDTLIQSGDISGASVRGFGFRQDIHSQLRLGLFDGGLFGEGLFREGLWFIDYEWHQLSSRFEGRSEQMTIWAVKPTLQFFFQPEKKSGLFYEAALGAAYLDEKTFEEVKKAEHVNFVMQFALGWQSQNSPWHVALRYNHYSNGYLAQPNPGIDFASLVLNYTFN